MTISNWPLYIDKKTVPNFEKATGVNVEYKEDINSNEEFFNKVQPQLTEGESGGRSIMVLADYMVAKMMKLGFLEELEPRGVAGSGSEPGEEPPQRALRSRTQVLACRGRAA